MSELMSEEQIREAFEQWLGIKPGRVNHRNHDIYRVDGIQWRWASFEAAFALLMPIIEKQNEALGELVHHCRDCALAEESFVIAMAVDKANDTIQETKQMLEKMGEGVK